MKGINLDKLPIERLKEMLYSELYIDIDSPFATELQQEIERRESVLVEE